MPVLNDDMLLENSGNIEIINPVGKRNITHIIHDIDGTHSVIRDWPPVMSFIIHWSMSCGLDDSFDSEKNTAALVDEIGKNECRETDRFCIESAGMSALTQMEFGVRRAIDSGFFPNDIKKQINPDDLALNKIIINEIWDGLENDNKDRENPVLTKFLENRTPRLFILYEKILNLYCRDANLENAKLNPGKWRVSGSIEFVNYLKSIGCLNYFVTGAVVYKDGGILEEVQTLGFPIGKGLLIEEIHGSSWNNKLPKEKVFKKLIADLAVDPEKILVIGDGRSEIQAGVELGCIAMSRLSLNAVRQRELHSELKTNYILPDFTSLTLRSLIRKGN